MRMQIVGFEGSSGTSNKTGKAYAIGSLHAMAPLAAPYGENGVAKGVMGTTYSCPLPLIMKIQGLPTPFIAEVEVVDIMRFGKREQEVRDISPVETQRKVA